MEALESILPEHLLIWVTTIVAICAAIATVLPAPKESSNVVYRAVYRVIQWVALNLGKAKNSEDPKSNTNQNGQQ